MLEELVFNYNIALDLLENIITLRGLVRIGGLKRYWRKAPIIWYNDKTEYGGGDFH